MFNFHSNAVFLNRSDVMIFFRHCLLCIRLCLMAKCIICASMTPFRGHVRLAVMAVILPITFDCKELERGTKFRGIASSWRTTGMQYDLFWPPRDLNHRLHRVGFSRTVKNQCTLHRRFSVIYGQSLLNFW